MIANLNLPKFKKAILLYFFVLSFSNINAATYYLKNSGGLWNVPGTWSTVSGSSDVNTGTFPQAGDDVIFDGTVARTLNLAGDESCTSIINLTTSTGILTPVITLNIGAGFTLTVSVDFANGGTPDYSRNTTLTGTGTMTVGGNINVGAQTLTATAARTNTMLFSGPNINVNGNVNIYNNVNSTIHIASSIVHSAGILTLTGNIAANSTTPPSGGKGYLNTFQNSSGLSTNNRYYLADGTASLVLFHDSDCPIYSETNVSSPYLNGFGSTVTYRNSQSNSSIIYGTEYNKLYLNNSNGYSMNGDVTVKNQLDLVAGILNTGANVFNMGSSGVDATINISSSGIIGTGQFNYVSNVNLNYSGTTVTAPGIELIYGSTNNPVVNATTTKLKTLTLNNVNDTFNLGAVTNDIYAISNVTVNNIVNTNATAFTCNVNIYSPTISITTGSTNDLTLNGILSSTISNSIVGNGINLEGNIISLADIITADGITNAIGNPITISATTSLSYSKDILATGVVSIISPTTNINEVMDPLPNINGATIIINGDATLNNLTSNGIDGITLTGDTLNLYGILLASGNITIDVTTSVEFYSPIEAIGTVFINGTGTGTANVNSDYATIIGSKVYINGAKDLYNLTAGGTEGITINGETITLYGALTSNYGGNIIINTSGLLNYKSTITATGNNVLLNNTSTTGTVLATALGSISSGSINIKGATTLLALTSSSVDGISITGGTVILNGVLTANTNGNITINASTSLTYNSTISAGGAVLINNTVTTGTTSAASTGTITAASINIKGATTLLALTSSSVDGISITGGTVILNGVLTANNNGNITITGTTSIKYAKDIRSATLGLIIITSPITTYDTSSNPLPIINGGSIEFIEATSATLYTLTANDSGGIKLNGSAITLNGALTSSTAGGNIIINTSGLLTYTSTITATGNNVSINNTSTTGTTIATSIGTITAASINIKGATTLLALTSSSVDGISITGGTVILNGVLTANTNGNITINASTSLTYNSTISAGGAVLINNTVTTGTTSAASTGTITAASINIKGATTLLALTSSSVDGISITGGTVILNGVLTANNNGNITINASTSLTYNSSISAAGAVLINNIETTGTTIAGSSAAVISAGSINIKGATDLYALSSSGTTGITLNGGAITLNGLLTATGSGSITINATGTLNYKKNIDAGGDISINNTSSTGTSTTAIPATSAAKITGNKIVIVGNSKLNSLVAIGEAGITLTGTTLTLNGPLTAPSQTAGFINITGNTTAATAAIILANTINLSGTSTYKGNITAVGQSTGLTVNGPTTFNTTSTINAYRVTVGTGATSTIFNKVITNLNYLTINGATTLVQNQDIATNLTLGANLTNAANIISTPYLNVTANSILTTTSGQIQVRDLLEVTNGAVLSANNDLTLLSSATTTARVGQVSTGAIVGNVTVERYLPGRRAWRLLTSPVSGTLNNTIYTNWQNNGANVAGYGTDAWGPGSTYTPTGNGLHYIPVSTHNIRKWNVTNFASVTNTITETLFDGSKNNAFLTFFTNTKGSCVGGAQGSYTGLSTFGATTLKAKGILLTGDQNYTVSNENYYLIGNPYASPLDFSGLISNLGDNGNTVTQKIWFIDPKISLGSYVTWDPNNGYSNTTNYPNNTITLIQSGQGFFVKGRPNATSSNFLIKETNKGSTTQNVFGKISTINYERLRVNLFKVENSTDSNMDACVVGFFEGANNAVDENDSQKFSNPTETLAFLNGSMKLSSEHRAPIVNNDVLFINLAQATAGSNYKLKINTENFTFSGTAYFYDLLLGTILPISLDGSVFEYPFNVTADSASQGTRFKIVFNALLGTYNNTNPNAIIAYPNPATDAVTLNLGTLDYGDYSYKIVNVLGQEVQKGTLVKKELNEEFKINFTTSLKSGWYSIQILNKNNTIFTLPILIN